jgi:gliding motility-associated-like protein
MPGVLVNDVDIDNTFTAILISTTSNGTLNLNSDGSFNYLHDGSETISDSFNYKVNDGVVDGNTVTVSITVTPQNDAPVANNDGGLTTSEDTALAIDVLSNDTDADNSLDVSTVTVVNGPARGIASVNVTTGVVTYSPALNYNGNDSFTYTIKDVTNTTSSVATVSISVTPVNDAPIAVDDIATTAQDGLVNINVLANDSDIDDVLEPAGIAIVGSPSNGSLTVSPTGVVTYIPAAGYVGSDSFTYTLRDPSGLVSNTAAVMIEVTPINNPPLAVDDGPFILENTQPFIIDVLSNDSDPDNTLDELTIVLVTDPQAGTVTIENRQLVYRRSGDLSGDDIFTYVISDPGGLTDTATVTIQYIYTPLSVSEGFSPNGDGSNETWYINNIESYPGNTVKVFDRWGILVFQANRYDNALGWSGRANTGQESGRLLDQGTYYYLLDLGNNKKMISGYVTIVR